MYMRVSFLVLLWYAIGNPPVRVCNANKEGGGFNIYMYTYTYKINFYVWYSSEMRYMSLQYIGIIFFLLFILHFSHPAARRSQNTQPFAVYIGVCISVYYMCV